MFIAAAADRSSEKVGRWALLEGEESGEGAKPLPSFVGPGVLFFIY